MGYTVFANAYLLLKKLIYRFCHRVTSLANWKDKSFNSILVNVNWFMKMVYYKLVKTTIDVSNLVKVIINIVMCYHGLINSIIND